MSESVSVERVKSSCDEVSWTGRVAGSTPGTELDDASLSNSTTSSSEDRSVIPEPFDALECLECAECADAVESVSDASSSLIAADALFPARGMNVMFSQEACKNVVCSAICISILKMFTFP